MALDPYTAYVVEALDGTAADRQVIGHLERLAYERHLRDIARQGTPAFPFIFDVAAADRIVKFFGYVRHYKGEWAGQPILLQRWQRFVLGSSFGWRHMTAGLRRFRKDWVEIPRKNGKSLVGGGVLNYATFFDNEPGAEGYAFATKKDQAKKIVWLDAKKMVENSPHLSQRIQANTTSIFREAQAQRIEYLGRDSQTQDGLNPHIAVGDEIHAMRDRNIVDVIETAMGARRQPKMFNITTAGNDRNTIGWELHSYSVQVLEGTAIDETWFAFIASADPGDDPFTEVTWLKANPNLGVSVKIEDMRSLATKAAHSSGALATFLQKRLNIWVNSAQKAIAPHIWKASAGEMDWRELRDACRGRRGVPGLDLSTKLDLTAEVWVFEDNDGGITLVPFFWCPASRIEVRTNKDRLQYAEWATLGAITPIPGTLIKQTVMRESMNDHADEFRAIHAVDEHGTTLGPMYGLDTWNASELEGWLEEDGWIAVPVRQGHQALGGPCRRFEELLAVGKVRHGNHPVLSWMAGNLVWRFDANGNFVPDKRKSTEKIDGLSATMNALFCLGQAPAEDQEHDADAAEVKVIGWGDPTHVGDDTFGMEFD